MFFGRWIQIYFSAGNCCHYLFSYLLSCRQTSDFFRFLFFSSIHPSLFYEDLRGYSLGNEPYGGGRLWRSVFFHFLYLTTRRRAGYCFQQIWSLLWVADLPKSRATLTFVSLRNLTYQQPSRCLATAHRSHTIANEHKRYKILLCPPVQP